MRKAAKPKEDRSDCADWRKKDERGEIERKSEARRRGRRRQEGRKGGREEGRKGGREERGRREGRRGKLPSWMVARLNKTWRVGFALCIFS
jgi:hypothetical protein